ncbi:LysR substrate-binding domain-containing protein [uncultured Microbulbifer sp.]|uniref:LysR substrate-binding domain-containing protein n=1 Tax=uncultured Microbulbifer sp. TaxID=348147 RepID=UPI002624DB34|nr:LysR substrate-binding domain-containing protein [uncultured Microbulbifer sp.]
MTPEKFERTLMARLKFRHLKLLVTVNEQRNIFKAAQALNMAQPAATKTIRELEKDLEVELFERSSRGVTPTLYGDILIRHAKLILAQVKGASEELASLHGGLVGRVTVGTLLAASATLLPIAIARLKKECPNVSIHILERTFDSLSSGLRIGDIDFVVGRLPRGAQGDGLNSEVLYHEPVVFAARNGHPLSKNKKITLQDLLDYEWILPPQTTHLRQEVDEALREAGIESPVRAVESVSILANRTLLEETDMISVMPDQVVRFYEKDGLLQRLPVTLNISPGPIGISLCEGRTLSPAANYLLDKLREVAAEHD